MNSTAINKGPPAQRESFTDLLGQLANSSAAVVHDEIALVIEEIREKGRAVRGGVFTVAIGAVIGFAALMSLCAASILALTSYMSPALAALVTGAVLASIGVAIAYIGYRLLKKSNLKT